MSDAPAVDRPSPTSQAGPTLDPQNPWPGPEAFGEQDHPYFFGRTRQRRDLARLVLQNRLVVLYGRSGLGKTSLLRAGVFPLLRDAFCLPVYVRLQVPGGASAKPVPDLRTQVKLAIEAMAAERRVDMPALDPSQTLWEWFYRSDARFFNERSRRLRPVLVLDQFEEMFTHGRATPAATAVSEAFLEELVDLVRGSAPSSVAARFEADASAVLDYTTGQDPCGVLLALRQEFLAELLRLRPRLPGILDHRFELTGMTIAEAEEVVTGPGKHLVDPQVPGMIAAFVAAARRSSDDVVTDDKTVDPAILSIFCSELNATRKQKELPRITAGLVSGQQDTIIADFYQRRVADLTPAVRQFVEDRLVTESGYRDSEALDEALRLPGITPQVIDVLTNRRLLRVEGSGARARLELTHDVLLDPIAQARNLRRLQEGEAKAREAAEKKQREARQAEDRHRTEQELERKRAALFKLGLLSAGLIVAVIVAGTFATRAWRAQRESEQNLATAHLAQGLGLIELGQRDRGLAYLARAVRVDPDNAVARSLAWDGVLHQNWPLPLATFSIGRFQASGFNTADNNVVTVSADGVVHLWNVDRASPAGERPLPGSGGVRLTRLTPNGRYLLAVRDDDVAHVVDVSDGREMQRIEPARSPIVAVAISATGNRVALGLDDGRVRIWPETSKRREISLGTAIATVALDPGGDRLITSTLDGQLAVWDVASGGRLADLRGHTDVVVATEFSRESGQILTASRDSTVRLWKWTDKTYELGGTLAHAEALTGATFSPDGYLLLTVAGATAQLWDARSAQPIGARMSHPDAITVAGFSPGGERIVTGSDDGTARVWDGYGTPLSEPMRLEAPAIVATFGGDGSRVVTVGVDGGGVLWDVRTGAALPTTWRAPCGVAAQMRLIPKTDEIVVLCSTGEVTVWQTNGKPVEHPGLDKLKNVARLEFSASGDLVVTSSGASVVVARWPGLDVVATLGPHQLDPSIAEFSADGRRLLTASPLDPLRVWDVASGKPLGAHAEPGEFSFAHLSADGSKVVAGRAQTAARVWDPGGELRAGRTIGPEALEAWFDASGTRLVVRSASAVEVFDIHSGTRVTNFPVLSGGDFVLPGPNGLLLIAGGPMQVWDWSRQSVINLTGSSEYSAASFSTDGGRVAARHKVGGIRVWDARTGEPQSRAWFYFDRQSESPPQFLTGSQRLAVQGFEKSFLWDVPQGEVADAAQLPTLVEALVGLRVNGRGGVERIADRLAALGDARNACRADTARSSICLWALADRQKRTINPFSATTVDEYILAALNSHYEIDREDARAWFPWDPRLRGDPGYNGVSRLSVR